MQNSFTLVDTTLIKECIKGNRKSQKRLYDLLSPKMFQVCLQFFRKSLYAEDVLQDGFIKLFSNLRNYRGEGSFEGWARKIFVNTAIQYYRSQKPLSVCATEFEEVMPCTETSALDRLYEKDVIYCTRALSKGYRTVFHLYAVEGYSHKEIAQMLGITESTSKSQYLRAKASIRLMMSEGA